jgi:nicotinate-nucleotide adenylyltransferase
LAEYIRQSVTLVEMPEIGISSTDIRLRRASGRSIRYLVPDPVHQYIEGKRLYES